MGSQPLNLNPLPVEFYLQPTVAAARGLLGHYLLRKTESGWEGGRIVETEAYTQNDPASHSFKGQTSRNAAMFGRHGTIYVYRSYGIHWCLNVVCQPVGVGEAILIRALEPTWGIEAMRNRRGVETIQQLCRGPGNVCRALGIDNQFNGACLYNSHLLIAAGDIVPDNQVMTTTRVGISQAVEQPWRFFIRDNPFVSARKR